MLITTGDQGDCWIYLHTDCHVIHIELSPTRRQSVAAQLQGDNWTAIEGEVNTEVEDVGRHLTASGHRIGTSHRWHCTHKEPRDDSNSAQRMSSEHEYVVIEKDGSTELNNDVDLTKNDFGDSEKSQRTKYDVVPISSTSGLPSPVDRESAVNHDDGAKVPALIDIRTPISGGQGVRKQP